MSHRTTRTEANPLRRAADRTRTRWHAAFVLACALAAMVGILAALAARDTDTRGAQEQARHSHRVTATVTTEPTTAVAARPGSRPGTTAKAQWQYPAGREHTGFISVPSRTQQDDRVVLWVDDGGRATTAPASPAEITMNAVGVGTGVSAVVVLCAAAVVHVRLRRIDAAGLRQWERDWERIEPLWTGRLRPGQGAGDD